MSRGGVLNSRFFLLKQVCQASEISGGAIRGGSFAESEVRAVGFVLANKYGTIGKSVYFNRSVSSLSSRNTSSKVQSVSELTQSIKRRLNDEFRSVLVSGEISGMTKAGSGHIYLTLKDDKSSINGIIWRSDAAKLKFDLSNGLAVECRGGIDVYAQRGTYQIIIRGIRPQGIGALELAFRQLHERLAGEGLLDSSVKKELPSIPKHICVVTSPTSAAVRDFLQVLTRRWPRIRVTVVPVKVQGPGAAEEIAEAIGLCNRMSESVDVIAVTRGGGSVEEEAAHSAERWACRTCAAAEARRKEKAEARRARYCVCRAPWDGKSFMIECNGCGEWYHGACVGLNSELSARQGAEAAFRKYLCPRCTNEQRHGAYRAEMAAPSAAFAAVGAATSASVS